MPIWQALIVFAVAFAVTYIMVPVSKRLANLMGAIDYPGERRVNEEEVPRAGGIALYCGFLAGYLTAMLGMNFFGWEIENLYQLGNIDYVLLFLGLSIAFMVGLIDDVQPLSPRSKFAGQIVSALFICLSGVTIGVIRWVITGEYVDLGWANIPLSVLYIVIFMNVINLIDGLDGLAAGIVAIIACGLLYLVLDRGNYTLAMFCIALIGVCLAFLRFNFHPASVFMGDSGSLFLGAVLGVISITGVARTQGLVVSLVPLVIAGIPIVDTASAIIRRLRTGHRIGEADMEHVHHRLLGAGYSQQRSVLILYVFSAVMAVMGCFFKVSSGVVRWSIFAALSVLVFIIIWRMRLFDPVLDHYYRRRDKKEPRRISKGKSS